MNKKTLKIAGWALGLSMTVAGLGTVAKAFFSDGGNPLMVKATTEDFSKTWNKSALEACLGGDYADASSYWKVPETAGKNATITLPFGAEYYPTTAISVSFHIATFGSGTNPSSSNTTITAADSDTMTTWTGEDVSTYPSSSTYVDGLMSIAKQDGKPISGLTVTMGVNSGIKIFRLQSITVSFTYDVHTDYVISTTTEGLSLSGDLGVNNGEPANIILTTEQRKKITSVALTGAGEEGEDWNYNEGTRTVSIKGVTSDVTISAVIGDAPIDSLSVTGHRTTFSLGNAFVFGGTVVATYDDDAETHGTKTLAANEFDIDDSKYDSSAVGDYQITISAGGVEFKYSVNVRALTGALPSGKYYIFTSSGALEKRNYTNSTSTKVDIYSSGAWTLDLVDDNTYTIGNGTEYLYSTTNNSGLRSKVASTNWTLTALTGSDAGKYSLTTSDDTDTRYLCDFNDSKNDWRTYKSGAKGDMYKLEIVEEKTAFGEFFITNFTCSGVTVGEPNGSITAENPSTLWTNLGTFKSNLSTDAQNILKTAEANEAGNAYEQALARYDLIIRKYTTSVYADFLGRFSEGGANYAAFDSRSLDYSVDSNLPLILAISSIGFVTLGGAFLISRRRKEDR
ncbi:MAG: hypothetical protein J6O18_02775 [Bacilli bacterium]|nr:hypothetical protein [Bacilli bacterium]